MYIIKKTENYFLKIVEIKNYKRKTGSYLQIWDKYGHPILDI